MAQPLPVGRIGQLKDQRVDIQERLQLAHRLWETKDDVGPNKHQVIVDAVTAILINNKKRQELGDAVEREVWQTLSTFLRSPCITAPSGPQSVISLRPSTAQMIVDALERARLKEKVAESEDVVNCVLDCCHCILLSPLLAPIITARLDILVSLCSVLCHLAVLSPGTDTTCLPAVLSQVTTHLWHHHHRSQLPPSQVLQLVTDKLLEVVIWASDMDGQLAKMDAQLHATIQSLRHFLLLSIFHESHHKVFKTYLDGVVSKPEDGVQLPWNISNIFTKMSTHLHHHKVKEKEKNKEGMVVEVPREAVLHFLPKFFLHAVTVWRQKNQMRFKLLVHLCSFLGVPAREGETEKIMTSSGVAMETSNVGALRQLLCVVRENNAYNVAADRNAGGEQLQFFRHVLAVLLRSPVCEEQCRCLVELLALNHLIVEPTLQAVLSHCCCHIHQMEKGCQRALDTWLCDLVSTYSQLHQLPRLYAFLLQLGAQSPRQLTDALPLPLFSQQMQCAVSSLTHNTAMELWGKLQNDIVTIAQRVMEEGSSDRDREQLWASVLLLHQYLSHLRIFDWISIATVGERVNALTSQLENDLVSPLLLCTQNSKSKTKLYAPALLLAVCLGNIKVMLATFMTRHVTLPTPTLDDLPFSIESPHCRSKKNKADADPVVQFLGDILTTQRLRLLQHNDPDGEWSERLEDITLWDDNSQHHECHWDEQLCNINENTYSIAKSHLWVYQNTSLLPALVDHHGDQLAQQVVHILSRPLSASHAQSNTSHHTCQSVAQHLLQQTAMILKGGAQNQEFVHKVVCHVWRQFVDTDTDTHLPSSLLSVLRHLSNAELPWHCISDREVKSVMESIQDLLSADVTTFTLKESHLALLQVLGKLPLTYLPSGTRLLCTVGLLVVLVHCDDRGVPGCELSGRELACRLLTELLDACVGTSLFLALSPHVLLSRLRSMAVQCAVTENSSMGVVLKKAITMVMGDFHSVLHLHEFVAELEKGWKKMMGVLSKKKADLNLKQHDHGTLLTVTHYVLADSRRHLKKDYFRQDVQLACRQHFDRLSSVVQEAIDRCEQHHSQVALHPGLLRCFTAVADQHCIDSKHICKPLTNKLQHRIQCVLSTLHVTDSQRKKGDWEKEELEFISCLYHHSSTLPTILTPDLTRTLWASLLASLRGNQATPDDADTEKPCCGTDDLKALILRRKRQSQESEKHVPNKRRRLDGNTSHFQSATPQPTKASASQLSRGGQSNGSGVGEGTGGGGVVGEERRGKEEMGKEKEIMEAMMVVLSSCPASLFTELLQQVVSSMASDVRHCAVVWQRVVSCSTISVEQRTLLESFCITVLEQFVQVMQRIHTCGLSEAVETGVAVVQCVTAMLNQHRMLSTKGTVLCLLCVSLLPLSHGGYEDFLGTVRAACDAVHAVLVHHPHTAHSLIHMMFAVASPVLKECIRRGDQKTLLESPAFIKPVTACAEQVHRLVTLLVSGGEVQRVVATLVSDYATTVQSVTLLPAVKKWLLSSMYACLDMCDKHAINQLRQRLPPGVRDVFHVLHKDYLAYHKYTGKV